MYVHILELIRISCCLLQKMLNFFMTMDIYVIGEEKYKNGTQGKQPNENKHEHSYSIKGLTGINFENFISSYTYKTENSKGMERCNMS